LDKGEITMAETKNTGTVKIPKAVKRLFEYFKKLGEEDTPFDPVFQRIQQEYSDLGPKEKEILFTELNNRLEIQKEDLIPLLKEMVETDEEGAPWALHLQRLRKRVQSPRLAIFQKVARNPGGIRFLLDFREDLMNSRRSGEADVTALDTDLAILLEMLFQEGFLYLEEITLDSPYRQIEIIKDRDMVHPMTSLEEMGQRLGRDRRCFALYHRLLPLEPIVFIEVALAQGLVRRISDIVEPKDDAGKRKNVDTAIFYSINNTQNGLAGLGLGKMLIVRVVDFLRGENERIKNFATLSPLPGFWDRYLRPILQGDDESFFLKQEDIPSYFSKKSRAKILEAGGFSKEDTERFCEALIKVLSGDQWTKDEKLVKHLQSPLIKIAYHYITQEKNLKGKPLNPVAGFHLGNGATVSEKYINFLANTSPKGLRESCGIMVNYIYTSNWLTQIRRSLRWVERFEIKSLFSR